MKKRRRWLWIVGFIVLFHVALLTFAVLRYGRPHQLEIREDVTFITGPLDERGYLDYETALNQRLSQGIRPEDNANVLLWQMMGPTPEGGHGMHPDYWKAMGVPAPRPDGTYLQDLLTWEKNRRKPDDPPDSQTIYNLQSRLDSGAWHTEDEAIGQAWVASQAAPLELARQASLKPQYYNPLVGRDSTTGMRTSLLYAILQNVQKNRTTASVLALRARLSIRAKQYDAAWADMMTLQRISVLLSRCGNVIERLVAIAIHRIAAAVMIETIDAANWDRATLHKKLTELQSLAPWHPFSEVMANERYVMLSLLEVLRRTGDLRTLHSEAGSAPTAFERRRIKALNWTTVFKTFNKTLAEAVRISKLDQPQEQIAAWEILEQDIRDRRSRVVVPSVSLLLDRITLRAEFFADLLVSLLIPAYGKLLQAEHRRSSNDKCIRTAFALAEYRLDTKAYPQSLNDLVPKYLPTLPIDPYVLTAPLVYRRTERGYALYNVGLNLMDEGGPRAKGEITPDDDGYDVPLPPIGPKPPPAKLGDPDEQK